MAKAQPSADVVQLSPSAKSEITVESCVPIPASRGRKGSSMYDVLPWLHMNVEDSFLTPRGWGPWRASAAVEFAKKKWPSRKHTLRKMPDGRVRIWRTA